MEEDDCQNYICYNTNIYKILIECTFNGCKRIVCDDCFFKCDYCNDYFCGYCIQMTSGSYLLCIICKKSDK